ncbi:MAG: hypothetical protein KGP28_06060 [Bdellovibrionales bacterium]|nr:hypothetical protein [Bdellovibrionales bacterium]
MIWGDIVNSVRRLHLHLVQEHSVDPALFTRDITLSSSIIHFPGSVDDFEEWEETPLPPDLNDLLPLHPVERALIEGPLLPIQIIRFRNAGQIESLINEILALEQNWLESSGTFSTARMDAARAFLRAEGVRLIVRAGLRNLTTAKDLKP